jgi:hypothetical protein
MRNHTRMTEEALDEVLRQWLQDLIDEAAGGVIKRFADRTGIKEPDINRAINRKDNRRVTLAWLTKISETEGMPSLSAIFGALAERCAIEDTQEVRRTQRERLQARIASGELRARAYAAAPARQPAERPEHPVPPPGAHGAKSDDRG